MAHFNAKLNLDDLNSETNFDEKNAFARSKLALTVFTKHMADMFKGKKYLSHLNK